MTPIENYLRYARYVKGYNTNTLKAYETDIRTFCHWLRNHRSDARWSTLTRADIDAYITARSQAGIKPATTNREISAISSIYGYFMREGLISSNPTKFENRKKIPERIPNTIPMSDIKNAWRWAQGPIKDIIGLLATTGARIQEVLDLKWQDIDFTTCAIKIHGKGERERIVYTAPDVLERLKTLLPHARKEFRIFYWTQREARRVIYDMLRPFTRARQISPHAIRHTYATELAKGGVNVATIAKLLGHKRIDTTQKYIDMAQIETASNGLTNIVKLTA